MNVGQNGEHVVRVAIDVDIDVECPNRKIPSATLSEEGRHTPQIKEAAACAPASAIRQVVRAHSTNIMDV